MTASSVTGIGQGSVDGNNKGSERMTLGVQHLIGPRVIASGVATAAGGTVTVTFPQPLNQSESAYVVMVTGLDDAAGYVSAKTDSSGQFASFTITGSGTNDYMWAVISTGYGLPQPPLHG